MHSILYPLRILSQKSPCERARESAFFFFMFTVPDRRCCQEAQNIVLFFDKQTHTHTHGPDRFLRASSIRAPVNLLFSPSLVLEWEIPNVCRACPIRNCISLILLNVCCFAAYFLTSLYGFISTFCSLFGWNGIFRCWIKKWKPRRGVDWFWLNSDSGNSRRRSSSSLILRHSAVGT